MAKLSAEEFADKLTRRLQAAGADIKLGVERVEKNPAESAAEAGDVWQAKMAESKTLARFKRGLGKVSKADWQNAMIVKGLPRIGPGVEAARSKIVAFASRLLPHTDALKEKLKGMPRLTLEDGIARSTFAIRFMAEFENE